MLHPLLSSWSRRTADGLGVVVLTVLLATPGCFGEPGGTDEPEQFDEQNQNQNQDQDQPEINDDNDGQQPDDNDGVVDQNQTDDNDDEPEPQHPRALVADDGEAKMAIVVGPEADPGHHQAAETLAEYLEKISGAEFEVLEGEGEHGIVLGAPEDFTDLPFDDVQFGDGLFEMEDYLLRSTEEALYLLGASTDAVRFAVWDLLYRFGHRQFFPTDTWEVVPERQTLEIGVDTYESPDFYSRQAPRRALRFDQRPWAHEAWPNWQIRNRTAPTFELETGHVYDSVIAANDQAFDDNPDYWGEVDGQRTSDAQPNVAHEDVQQMFVDHAIGRLQSNPDDHSVPMDPRDGNPWSTSEESTEIGGPSEQAVFLANLVAEAIVDQFGDDKYVGMYAYNDHSPPPEIDVHPNVIISLATSFIRGGYTFEQMLEGWSERTNMIGIREYYSLWEWEYSLPTIGANAGDTEYLAESLPYYHENGARFINAESNDTWGGYGLGYYLSARMLWDIEEAERVDELIDDFIDKAFGPAADPMADFYEVIDGASADPYAPQRDRPLNDDTVGRMYRLLDEAREIAAEDDEVVDRIDDLILYTRYVDLFRQFDETEGPERQQIFDEVVSFAWRMRETMMAESISLSRYINRQVQRDDHLEWGEGYSTNQPADRHREDEDEPFSDAEIESFLAEGIENHDLLNFDIDHWEDDGDLTPAGFEPDEAGGPGTRNHRGSVEALVYTDDGTLPELTLSAGHIYDDRGPLRWAVETRDGEPVDDGEIPPDQTDRTVELSADEPGIYRLLIDNTGQGFQWDYTSRGAKTTLLAGGEHNLARNWYDLLYFYVPEGTDEFHIAGSFLEDRFEFTDGLGVPVDDEDVEVVQNYTVVDVPEDADGEVWSLSINSLTVNIRLLDLPGYMAFSPDELLLPEKLEDEF